MWSRLIVLVVAATATLAMGCPRKVQVPAPSGSPMHCTTTVDCNSTTCGAERLCVDGLCEAQPSLVIPCPGGVPVVTSP